jgi:hypothetical protein
MLLSKKTPAKRFRVLNTDVMVGGTGHLVITSHSESSAIELDKFGFELRCFFRWGSLWKSWALGSGHDRCLW